MLVHEMGPSFFLCIRQPEPTATAVIILLWLTRLGFLGVFILAPDPLSVSFLSGFGSIKLSDLQALKREDLFSSVKMAQGKF